MKDGSFWVLSKQIHSLCNKLTERTPVLTRLLMDWEYIVGTELATLCRPLKIKKQAKHAVLHLHAASSGAATILSYRQDHILASIQRYLGSPEITSLVFIHHCSKR
ncbi:MAG: DUF721 domain-containing protein [Burkholderiales bacterium]